MNADADVAVVGCGPVGVMLALRCVQHGLSVVAVDLSTEVFPLPRAIGTDDEIQRLFQNAGLEDLIRSVSTPLRGAEFVDAAGNRIVGIDFPEGYVGPNGHPTMAMFDQPALERGLRSAAVEAGVRMELGAEATSITDHGDSVTVALADGHGEPTTLEVRWLVGADGATSTIRRLAGIELVDQGFDQEWLVADTWLLDPACELPTVAQQVCDPERVVTFVPGFDGRRRWEIKLHAGESAEEMLDSERIAGLLTRWARPDQLRIDRRAVYRFHALVAERFRSGQVFLAGDAAHQMPPFNGQGMNAGMRDAANLAWKLGLVADGAAGPGLLDTYDVERRPHAEGQVRHSADAGRLIDAIAAGIDVTTDAGYGGGRPFPHLEHGIVFGDRRGVGRPVPQPTIGDTRLDDLLGPGFALIGHAPMSDATRATWDRLGAAYVPVDHPDLARLAPCGHTIVVRPDRYVAAVTDDLDTTTEQIREALCTT